MEIGIGSFEREGAATVNVMLYRIEGYITTDDGVRTEFFGDQAILLPIPVSTLTDQQVRALFEQGQLLDLIMRAKVGAL